MCKKELSAEIMAENIQSGDQSDFGRLLHLCAYVPENLLEEAAKFGYDEEDVFQEAAVAVLRAIRSFDKNRGAGFRTYCSACVKNHIISLLRSEGGAKGFAMADYLPIEELSLVSGSQPESDWIDKEAFSDLKKLMEKTLSPLEYAVLGLWLEGFSYESIGKKLCKNSGSVSNALSRARKKLRNKVFPEK